MGGTVMEFFQLLKHLDTGHAIYGFHSRGMDGIDEPFDRIEDLAQYYLEGIRTLKIRGPYILIGYSLGGLVALEMAQRLSDAGEKTALLFFLEAYPHRRYLPLGHNSKYYLRRLVWLFFRALRRYGLKLPNPYRSEADRVDGPEGGKKFARVIKRAASAAMVSWKCYRPRYYKGTINFVTRTKKEMYPTNPTAAWSPLADELIVDTVHGGHLGMVAVHFKELAAVLSRYLREIR
jgi:acetoacetyl-CoA synthetase